MNNKKTNYLVAIFDVIAIISFYLLYFTSSYLTDNMMTGGEVAKCIYNNSIIDFLLININIVMIVFSLGISIPNIISAIQNRKNKKLCFWQFAFGIIELSSAIEMAFLDDSTIKELLNRIMFIAIPILLAIKNIIFIKKNKSTKLQIFSYILAIGVAIVDIFGFLGAGTSWSIIAIFMQFIYIYNQDNNVVETNGRKIVNVIVYCILQAIVVITFLFMIIYSLLVVKINEIKWKNELSILYNDLTTLQEITNKEIYIPVENDYKYGFIDTNRTRKDTL